MYKSKESFLMLEQKFAGNRQNLNLENKKKYFFLFQLKKKCVTHCNRVARLSDPLNRKSMTRKLTQSDVNPKRNFV